jgi:hypothetical protein
MGYRRRLLPKIRFQRTYLQILDNKGVTGHFRGVQLFVDLASSAIFLQLRGNASRGNESRWIMRRGCEIACKAGAEKWNSFGSWPGSRGRGAAAGDWGVPRSPKARERGTHTRWKKTRGFRGLKGETSAADEGLCLGEPYIR